MSSSRISTLIRRPAVHTITQYRLAQRPTLRFIATATTESAPTRPSFFRRAFSFTGRALLFTTLGFIMAAAPAYETVSGYITPVTDEDSCKLYVAPDDEAQAHQDHINNHPIVKELRANPEYTESRPHLKIPPAWRAHNLTGGTLLGPGKVPVPPFAWGDSEGKSYVQICYVGKDLCGHPGVVHGGFLATVLDEGLARCCFAALPHKVGLTANLNINYKAPCMAGQYIVLRGTTTKVEGRKAWVEGRIETLTGEGETPVVLAEATALYIEPRQAAALANFYAAT